MADRNALWLEGAGCGELFFAGGGRGPLVTASAVVGDLFAVAAGELGQRPLPRPSENEW
jgi:homoserine dehydrogenase